LQLSLKQAEVASVIGVSEACITFWENNRSYLQIKHYPKIIAFLGYNPFPVDISTLGGKVTKHRIEKGLSHRKFGELVGVDASTIAAWEQNTHKPSSKAVIKMKELGIIESL